MKPFLAALFLLGMLTVSAGMARADLITNGGFESAPNAIRYQSHSSVQSILKR